LAAEGGQKAAMRVILDRAEGRLAFDAPRTVIRADNAAEVPAALAALELARAGGKWLAGGFGYELGYALEPRLQPLMPAVRDGPLILFGVYDAPAKTVPPASGRAYAGPQRPEWDRPAYGRRFRPVKDAIAAGDIYQANLSFRTRFAFLGDPRALYEQLRAASQAPHCAFLDDDIRQVVSLSPELFFEIEGGVIRARPMKGTLKRSGNADAAERAALAASAKDRAENLMIVDLIRNDLGRIAATGSVAVTDMFAVETYPALHTMVSTVTAKLRTGVTVADIVRALFPCGSITGAPKIKAMEILRALESSPRGAYCGAIGFFAPDGGARFNVAIRTLTISSNPAIADSGGVLGIGGGVVQDSKEDAEYAECLLKARFFEDARRPLTLIETLKFDGEFVRLERHLARLAASAKAFGRSFDRAEAEGALDRAVAGQGGPLRVRLTLDEQGLHQAMAAPVLANPPHWTYALSPERVASDDLLLRHKTDWRELYDRQAAAHQSDEVIFRNERGELTEGARSNIFVKRGGRLLTPPLSSGLLPGVLRAQLIERGCEETVLTEADLAGEVYFGNSLRGLVLAKRL
jgi:para-aminobenzoate synthetase/4-amino-4-deoxychorismate lyase